MFSAACWIVASLLTVVEGHKCGFPGRPAYGRVSLIRESYSESTTVTYSCDNGYNLLGQATRTCQSNGSWTGKLPVCDISLVVQRIPETSGYLYAYPPSNALDGSKSTCFYTTHQQPRWWRIDLGEAYHVLSVAISVPHVNTRQELTVSVVSHEGSKAVFSRCASFSGKFSTQTVVLMCDEGKGLVGQYVDIADKRIDVDYFSLCEVEIFVRREKYPCGDPDRPPKSYTVPLSPHEMQYRCIAGFKLSGSSRRSCLPSGQWSGSTPECLEVACPALAPLENGHVATDGAINGRLVQGSKLVYHCDPGFLLEGNETRVCQEDARWGGYQPYCTPVKCDIPNVEVDGGVYTLLNVSTTYGSLAELNCHLGYEKVGTSHTIVCQEDGLWSKPESSCMLTHIQQNLEHTQVDANETNPALTGMVAGIIAIAFLFFLSMCILLLLKKNKYFSRQKKTPLKDREGTPNSNGVSYTESSGTIYQNEDFYMEIPLKPPTNGTVTNGSTNGILQPLNNNVNKEKDKPNRRKSSTPSGRSLGPLPENIYEEISTGARKATAPNGDVNHSASNAAEGECNSPDAESALESPAVYAQVDFEQKRRSRLGKEKCSDPVRATAGSPIKLRDLPPIPPPEDEERGAGVAMSLVGAVAPLSSLAPHVVEGNSVYVGHPLVADVDDNSSTIPNGTQQIT
ncbi:sushi, von Willebrand factor type A, EGF and pentraxin domain-containing protein 1-like [Ornithodoros turicata]|uniref:sushi, von Willebrand factor type A, EGF and pentraxin domain-containing protein 1-like n=1 Tax=Ornithodoros turicata TaxID=34597 RepID=UPI00313987E4